VKVSASEILAKEGIDITGQNVAIEAGNNTTDSHQTFEFKQTGLTVTVGNSVVSATTQVVNSVDRAAQVEDDRLAALHGWKAVENGKDAWKTAHGTNPDTKEAINPKEINVSVSFGSSKQESETTTHTSSAVGSSLQSEGQVNITAKGRENTADGNINIIGSSVDGKDILLDAANDVNLLSAANTMDSDSESSQKSASVGVDLTKGGVTVSGQLGNGETDEHSLSYNETTITAEQKLTIKSGNDTNLVGAQAKGDTVEVDVKGDLNLASQQDSKTYTEKNESVGGSIGASTNLSANEGKIDSDYKSVNEQTGIFAGKGGFDIDVVGNTDLKGAVIGSEAESEKNRLSTGTLTFSDMENKAEYESNSTGVNYAHGDDVEAKNRGMTPNMGIAASGQESSTTKAAVAQGTIEIKDQANQKDDISKLSRDTENALNKLDEIFDKKTVEEQQELAKMFGEIAFEKIHDLSKDKGWDEGSPEKIALHAFVGAVMADMGGGDALSGGFSTAVNEAMQNELVKLFRGNPDLHQWASAILGAAAAEVVGGDALTGASTAASATKNNIYKDLDIRIQTDLLVNGKTDITLSDGSTVVVELDDVTLAAHAVLIAEALEKADNIDTALMQLPQTAPAGV
ncbi:hemagglutinin repeat-containing protein, partial [Acetonema longum]|uniref:hemagglutinin repeat-containing protein n=1 Tax=Acetonema longum TaxID=2374 RepID=UPI00187D5365